MLHQAPLALLLAAAAAPGSPAGDDGQDWVALPLPGLCQAPLEPLVPARLEAGWHVLLPGDPLELARLDPAPALPVAALLGLLQDDARARGLDVRFEPHAPPLLARGAPADIERLRGVVEALDASAQAWTVELRAWVTPGASDAGAYPQAADLERALGGASAPWASASLRSGATAVLGARRAQSFVADYGVEVATDSGVSAPLLGRLLVGRTLHVRASRAGGGRMLHLEGFLDWSELAGLEGFDTETPDLGLLQQPRVNAVQVAFSGSVASGGLLAVSAAGTPLSTADWTLWLEARTQPDPAPREGGWRALDLALLERGREPLQAPEPGEGHAEPAPRTAGTGPQGLSASVVAQAGDAARDGGGRGQRSAIAWAPGLLLAPSADAAAWAEMERLVAAVERERLSGAELELVHGPLRVRLPLAEGTSARVLAGSERTFLTDYEVHVAQETWMPAPRVERARDGVLLQGSLRAGRLDAQAWSARSAQLEVLGRDAVGLGRLQRVERSFRSAAVRPALRERVRALPELDGDPALEVALAPARE